MRNDLLADIVVAAGGVVTSKGNRNTLLQDWLDAVESVPVINYVARLNGDDQWWLLSNSIIIPSDNKFGLSFVNYGDTTPPNDGIFSRVGGLNYLSLRPDNTLEVNENITVTIDGLSISNNDDISIYLDGYPHNIECTAVNEVVIDRIASLRFSGFYFKGAVFDAYFNTSSSLIELPLTNRELAENQISNDGSITAVMQGYSDSVWIEKPVKNETVKYNFDANGWSGNSKNLSSLEYSDGFVQGWGALTRSGFSINQADDVYAIQVDWGDDPLWSLNGGAIELETGSSDTRFRGGLSGNDNDFYLGKQWRVVSAQEIFDKGISEGQFVPFRLDNVMYYPEVLPGKPRAKGEVLSNARGDATIVLTFDDGGNGIMSNLQYFIDNDLQGTIYMPWAYVGQAGKLTVADLQQLKSLGWDIQLDGTEDDTTMLDLPGIASVKQEIQNGIAWAESNGLGTPRHICYPFGQHRSPTVEERRNDASCSVGSNLITMADTAGITAGMECVHRNFSQGTTVVSVDSSTQLTMSSNASLTSSDGSTMTSTVSDARFVDTSGEFYTSRIPNALSEVGIVTGRTTSENFIHTKYGVDPVQAMILPSYGSIVNGSNPAEGRAQQWIDAATEYGSTVFVTLHDINAQVDFVDTTWQTAKLWFDKLVASVQAGDIKILTVDEVYERDF